MRMKKDFIIGGLLAFLFATSSCTTTHNEGAAAVELFPPPLMGWSSWNTYHVNISEDLIRKQAEALVTNGLKDAGTCISMWMMDFSDTGMKPEKCMRIPDVFPMG